VPTPRRTSTGSGEASLSRRATNLSSAIWLASPRSHARASSAAGDSPRTRARTTPPGRSGRRRRMESANAWYGASSVAGATISKTTFESLVSACRSSVHFARRSEGSCSKYAAKEGRSNRARWRRSGAMVPAVEWNSVSTNWNRTDSVARAGSGNADTKTNWTRSPCSCFTLPKRCVLPCPAAPRRR